MDQQSTEYLSKRQRWLRRQQEQESAHHRNKSAKRFKKFGIWVATVLVVGGGIGWLIWSAATQPPLPAGDIVSKNGIHWHPQLTITMNGKDQEIPANIGLGGAEEPIHTHDTTGTLHLEFPGLVTKDDIRLGHFFKIWGKTFTSQCIFDSCNGPNGQVAMTVNGKSNTEFDQYIMRDKDQIEITYSK
ncbi:MAG: hypothetical protein HY092_02950 [Candidatus Kerfeldbacteria bacterium]|nr:hypothetical protein [Candidatus Kerfeldbacteria bacterium]